MRSWFKDFDVEKCQVSPNFTAPFMLAFLLSRVLESVGASSGKEAREAVGQSTLRDWADLWSDRSKVPAVFQELQNLPNDFQGGISAGFSSSSRASPEQDCANLSRAPEFTSEGSEAGLGFVRAAGGEKRTIFKIDAL